MKKLLLMLLLVTGLSLAMFSTTPVTLEVANDVTDWVKLNKENRIEFNVSVVSVSTNVVIRPESAFYQATTSTYFPVSLVDAATAGGTPDDITLTATGNYRFHKDNGISSKFIRLKLVSFSGATPNILVNITGKRD